MSQALATHNPFEWVADKLGLLSDSPRPAHTAMVRRPVPAPRTIGTADLTGALRAGFADFIACRTDVLSLCLVYPLAGLVMFYLSVGYNLIPLIFPLAAGFTLLGPLFATGLYEMSRRRETGAGVSWLDAFGAFRSPAIGSILTLGVGLLALFGCWLAAAHGIYGLTMGPLPPSSIGHFARDLVTTPAGLAMVVLGTAVGFGFAVVVLAISVVSFPLMLDRGVGVAEAVQTSIAAVRANPGPIAAWGLIVAALLALGSLPFLVGLAVVLPVLGHGTWHLYRRILPG